MKRWMTLTPVFLVMAWLTACETAPITGRSQLILVDDAQVQALGLQAYQEMKQKQSLSNDQALNNVSSASARISPGSAPSRSGTGNSVFSRMTAPMPSLFRAARSA